MAPRFIRGVQYSDLSTLNTLQICMPSGDEPATETGKIWIVFIHGGAWRDPTKLEGIFDKATELLLESSEKDSIAAVASIGYRLSPHPNHPIQPDDPNDPARNAKHPDHINDVLDALHYLQHKYKVDDRYILAGHSAGATLALQVCMSRTWSQTPDSSVVPPAKDVVPPMAVLGLEGIYDIPELIAYHKSRPYYNIYDEFTHSAFGSRIQQQKGLVIDAWSAASPTEGRYASSWENGSLVVLAHSHEDELVEWEQVELIEKALQRQEWSSEGKRKLCMLELSGKHDQIVNEGAEVAKAVKFTIGKLAIP